MPLSLLDPCIERTTEIAESDAWRQVRDVAEGSSGLLSYTAQRLDRDLHQLSQGNFREHAFASRLKEIQSLYGRLASLTIDARKCWVMEAQENGENVAFCDDLGDAQDILNRCRLEFHGPEDVPVDVKTHWMDARFLPEVLAMGDAYSEPLTAASVVHRLGPSNCFGFIGRIVTGTLEDTAVDAVIYETTRDRISVLNAVSHPQFQLEGMREIIMKVQTLLTPTRKRILIDVHERELALQRLLQSLKFRAITVLRDQYPSGDGAYRMQYRTPISEHAGT